MSKLYFEQPSKDIKTIGWLFAGGLYVGTPAGIDYMQPVEGGSPAQFTTKHVASIEKGLLGKAMRVLDFGIYPYQRGMITTNSLFTMLTHYSLSQLTIHYTNSLFTILTHYSNSLFTILIHYSLY